MATILTVAISIIVGIITIFEAVTRATKHLITRFKDDISGPINSSISTLNVNIKGLRDDLNDFNESRKEHEKKLFDISDSHTKDIYEIKGRVKTLETVTKIDSGGSNE